MQPMGIEGNSQHSEGSTHTTWDKVSFRIRCRTRTFQFCTSRNLSVSLLRVEQPQNDHRNPKHPRLTYNVSVLCISARLLRASESDASFL